MRFWWASTQSPSAALAQQVAAAGFMLWIRPLVTQVPAKTTPALMQLLQQALQSTWRVFVSPYSVIATHALVPQLLQNGQIAAVGATTQAAVQRFYPLANVLIPEVGTGMQALWQTLEPRLPLDQSVAIFCAPNGVRSLQEALDQRRQTCIDVPIYQRQALPLTQQEQLDIAASPHWMYVGALSQLPEQTFAPYITKLWVPSERVAAAARERGFTDVIVTSTDLFHF